MNPILIIVISIFILLYAFQIDSKAVNLRENSSRESNYDKSNANAI